jgi:hypothetical protein
MPNSNAAIRLVETLERHASQAGEVPACLHWITIAPRRRNLRPSLKAKTMQSTGPCSRGSPRVISGWRTLKKSINGKSGKRIGRIPPARLAGLASADIPSHYPSARYISPRDVASTAIKSRTNGCPDCTSLHHPIRISRTSQTTTIPNDLVGCWRRRNSSARFSVRANRQSTAPSDRSIAEYS